MREHCKVMQSMAMVYSSTPKALVLVQMFWTKKLCSTTLHFAAEGCRNAKQSIVISFCT